jgi:hypothetical protein
LLRATKETAWPILPQHKIQFVGVDKDVKLEVFDWGGSGRPLVHRQAQGRHRPCQGEGASRGQSLPAIAKQMDLSVTTVARICKNAA